MDAKQMRRLGDIIKKEIGKDVGFCLLCFPLNKAGTLNYISNAERESMIVALEEAARRFKVKGNPTQWN